MKAVIIENNNKNRPVNKSATKKVEKNNRLLELAKKVAGSLKDVDIPGWETPESSASWVHDLRHMSPGDFYKKYPPRKD